MTHPFYNSTVAARRERGVRKLKLTCLLVVALAMLLSLPSRALACACCADSGEWYEVSEKVGANELGELALLKFAPAAKIFMSVAGDEGIEGVASGSDAYTLAAKQTGRRWTFTLRDEKSAAGTLTLNIPLNGESFGVDLRDASDNGLGPSLYKEWRFAGRVDGTGIFKKGIAPNTKFRLILQGRGNHCRSASDFQNWILQVNGPRASYAFYGTFQK